MMDNGRMINGMAKESSNLRIRAFTMAAFRLEQCMDLAL